MKNIPGNALESSAYNMLKKLRDELAPKDVKETNTTVPLVGL